jgi:hypothetical protein
MDNPGVRVWLAQTAATDDAAAVADGDAARGGQIPAIRQGSPAPPNHPATTRNAGALSVAVRVAEESRT